MATWCAGRAGHHRCRPYPASDNRARHWAQEVPHPFTRPEHQAVIHRPVVSNKSSAASRNAFAMTRDTSSGRIASALTAMPSAVTAFTS